MRGGGHGELLGLEECRLMNPEVESSVVWPFTVR